MTDPRDLGRSLVRSVLERVGRGVGAVQERKPLASDLLESDDAYLVVFDAPGAEPTDVQVRFVDDEVRVRIDRFRDYRECFEMRFPGRGLSLSGRATLPAGEVDPDAASARLTSNGTLQVHIPKSDEATDVPVAEETEAVESGTDVAVEADEDGAGDDVESSSSQSDSSAADA